MMNTIEVFEDLTAQELVAVEGGGVIGTGVSCAIGGVVGGGAGYFVGKPINGAVYGCAFGVGVYNGYRNY